MTDTLDLNKRKLIKIVTMLQWFEKNEPNSPYTTILKNIYSSSEKLNSKYLKIMDVFADFRNDFYEKNDIEQDSHFNNTYDKDVITLLKRLQSNSDFGLTLSYKLNLGWYAYSGQKNNYNKQQQLITLLKLFQYRDNYVRSIISYTYDNYNLGSYSKEFLINNLKTNLLVYSRQKNNENNKQQLITLLKLFQAKYSDIRSIINYTYDNYNLGSYSKEFLINNLKTNLLAYSRQKNNENNKQQLITLLKLFQAKDDENLYKIFRPIINNNFNYLSSYKNEFLINNPKANLLTQDKQKNNENIITLSKILQFKYDENLYEIFRSTNINLDSINKD